MARVLRRATKVSPPAPESADQVLRRHLSAQLAVIVKREPQALKGSVEALHDIRVALRRMRSLCMTFEKLDKKFLASLDRRASKLCDRMGDARDLDVWIALFRDMVRKGGGDHPVSDRDRRAVLALLRRERTRLAAEALSCGSFRRVKQMLREYLRRRLPRRRKERSLPEVYEARRMLIVRRLIEDRYKRVGNYSKNPAHDLRRAGRRMRYLSEFYAEGLGNVCVRAGRWITKAQAALGKMHDCDSALDLSQDLPTGKARAAVRRALKKRRAEFLRKFKVAWRHYANPRLQEAWLARLKAVSAGRA